MHHFKYIIFSSFLLLLGCAGNISPNTYSASEVGQVSRIIPATVVSMRQVNIDNNSGTGGVAGAIAGGAAGAALGNSGSGSVVGAVGGAVVGGLIGQGADQLVNHRIGFEYILKLTKSKRLVSVVQSQDIKLHKGQHVLVSFGAMTRIIPDNT